MKILRLMKKIEKTIRNDKIKIMAFVFTFSFLFFNMCHAQKEIELKVEKYANNAVKRKGAVLENKKIGYWISYDSTGRIEDEMVYINDTLNGPFYHYYENGNIRFKGYMFNGKSNGEWIYYYENGNLRMKGKYQEGEASGIWEFYVESGEIDKRILVEGKKTTTIEDNHLTPAPPIIPN
jgi:antitoxin component YwqK of YwqJK toxin-antitoxin module